MARATGLSLAALAKAGFLDLSAASESLEVLAEKSGDQPEEWLQALARAADPEAAVSVLLRLSEEQTSMLRRADAAARERMCLLFGASAAFGDFVLRQPGTLIELFSTGGHLVAAEEAQTEMRRALQDEEGNLRDGTDAWNALRVAYRKLLASVMLWDLEHGASGEATVNFDQVAGALSVLAGAAVDAGLEIARHSVAKEPGAGGSEEELVALVELGIVAMGKCGAEELNVVSDVDVIFVVRSVNDELLDGDSLIRLGTKLARETMRAIHDAAYEPPLWQLDANLRPEGQHGALVRTLSSMRSYYERWAKGWEFQALLKARPLAGSLELAQEFVDMTRAGVWSSASREDFVGSVQRMRERVTEHISVEDLDVQLKLGPGGLRDIEFSVQLLQLVHGAYDESLRQRGTLAALEALVAGGYIARSDGDRLSADYRFLRVLEHRLQLRYLRRTALMPREEGDLRQLARASGLAESARSLVEQWESVKREVRELHVKIFYAPLLSAVAALPEEDFVLGSEEAKARLATIGFADPSGAIRHLSALTGGSSRGARIHRNLMPVLLQWLGEGTDPDFGLLSFRKISEANATASWYARLLRDGTETSERLTKVLANSRHAAALLETIPEAVQWLERDELLMPVDREVIVREMRSLASRRSLLEDAAAVLRTVHRREILRVTLGSIVGVIDERQVSQGLDAAHTALLQALTESTQRTLQSSAAIALIGMGRFGGGELGFASDVDVVAVFQPSDGQAVEVAAKESVAVITELRRLASDPRFPVDLDFDLRPEGKNGPLARSLDSFRSYYEKWSVTWETQALLRARYVAGDEALGAAFMSLADEIRYPEEFSLEETREVRRIKARVEAERLPQGADPKRHLKLGPGGISDVEWLVQLLQLQHGATHPALQTVSTLDALHAARDAELLERAETTQLSDAWRFASRIRSALKLWSGRSSDLMPTDWRDLEGIAGVLGMPYGHTGELQERWLTSSRRAREVFERRFYGREDRLSPFQ